MLDPKVLSQDLAKQLQHERAQRIQSLRKKIVSGKYQVKNKKLAKALLCPN